MLQIRINRKKIVSFQKNWPKRKEKLKKKLKRRVGNKKKWIGCQLKANNHCSLMKRMMSNKQLSWFSKKMSKKEREAEVEAKRKRSQ